MAKTDGNKIKTNSQAQYYNARIRDVNSGRWVPGEELDAQFKGSAKRGEQRVRLVRLIKTIIVLFMAVVLIAMCMYRIGM